MEIVHQELYINSFMKLYGKQLRKAISAKDIPPTTTTNEVALYPRIAVDILKGMISSVGDIINLETIIDCGVKINNIVININQEFLLSTINIILRHIILGVKIFVIGYDTEILSSHLDTNNDTLIVNLNSEIYSNMELWCGLNEMIRYIITGCDTRRCLINNNCLENENVTNNSSFNESINNENDCLNNDSVCSSHKYKQVFNEYIKYTKATIISTKLGKCVIPKVIIRESVKKKVVTNNRCTSPPPSSIPITSYVNCDNQNKTDLKDTSRYERFKLRLNEKETFQEIENRKIGNVINVGNIDNEQNNSYNTSTNRKELISSCSTMDAIVKDKYPPLLITTMKENEITKDQYLLNPVSIAPISSPPSSTDVIKGTSIIPISLWRKQGERQANVVNSYNYNNNHYKNNYDKNHSQMQYYNKMKYNKNYNEHTNFCYSKNMYKKDSDNINKRSFYFKQRKDNISTNMIPSEERKSTKVSKTPKVTKHGNKNTLSYDTDF